MCKTQTDQIAEIKGFQCLAPHIDSSYSGFLFAVGDGVYDLGLKFVQTLLVINIIKKQDPPSNTKESCSRRSLHKFNQWDWTG
jgi:hypothetical protein